ncbi:dihydrofolate reductase family protein [Pseudomonas sp. Bout1]|nr:dihydrofolate reductase family protein [Pseudomonas sp. Bout1]
MVIFGNGRLLHRKIKLTLALPDNGSRCFQTHRKGGQTIQAFLEAGLINELIITRIPVVLGQGIPLFSQSGSGHELRHIGTYASDNGFVQSRYEVSGKR